MEYSNIQKMVIHWELYFEDDTAYFGNNKIVGSENAQPSREDGSHCSSPQYSTSF